MASGFRDDDGRAAIETDDALFRKLEAAYAALKERVYDPLVVRADDSIEADAAVRRKVLARAHKRKSAELLAPTYKLFLFVPQGERMMQERIMTFAQDMRAHDRQHLRFCDLFDMMEYQVAKNLRWEVRGTIERFCKEIRRYGAFLQQHEDCAAERSFLRFPSYAPAQAIKGVPYFNTEGTHSCLLDECDSIEQALTDFGWRDNPLKARRISTDTATQCYRALVGDLRKAAETRLQFRME